MPFAAEYDSLVPFPRLEAAKRLVPKQFELGYDWFLAHEGQVIQQLPFGKGTPTETGYPLARQSGIHSPSEKTMTYPGKRYVLSVHSSDLDRYPDKEPIVLDDGTWVIDYAAQDNRPSKTKQDYNGWLINCLTDGVPVGIMTKRSEGGYLVRGLAFVENYNPVSHSFLLHGPVNHETQLRGCFDLIDLASLSRTDREGLENEGVAEQQKLALRVQRRRQDAFRKILLNAYESRCAVTGTCVPEVLQAAHIEPYRGQQSQSVDNGILLRADIHLLFDTRLLGIEPLNHTIVLHDRLRNGEYSTFDGKAIVMPANPAYQPNDRHLRRQYELFLIQMGRSLKSAGRQYQTATL